MVPGTLARALPRNGRRRSERRHARPRQAAAAAGFDAVLSTRVLSHLRCPSDAFAEMARVLAPGGVAILSNVDASHRYTATRLPIQDGHVVADTYKHTREKLEAQLVEAGFEHRRSMLIEEHASTTAIDRLSQHVGRPVAGWISAWSRVERVFEGGSCARIDDDDGAPTPMNERAS